MSQRASAIPPAPAHGVALLDKPPGMTSHDVVSRVRYHLGTKRVGHAGTLDPMATGLLLVGVGQGTKLLTYAVGLPKTYTATIRLGYATISDDAQGEIVGERARPQELEAITRERLESSVDRLRGNIKQVPSAVSAIKVNGQRAYARVRSGQPVELKARDVEITRFDILKVHPAAHPEERHRDLDVVIDCSSGTYVRALARDLGRELGVGAHLTALRRIAIGPYTLDDAQAVPERDAPRASETAQAALTLTPLGRAASRLLPVMHVSEAEARALRHGQFIHRQCDDTTARWPVAATLPTVDELVALVEPARPSRDMLKPVLVFGVSAAPH